MMALLLLTCLLFTFAPSSSAPPTAGTSRTYISAGPPSRTVDVCLLAEGYTEAERGRWHRDVTRLVDAVFVQRDAAFHSFVPIMNVHAVFVPSRASGVGLDEPLDTTYRLYREASESFRSILPSVDSYDRADAHARALAPGCDFAVIVVNDEFYGGLGDRIAIISASPTSGALALRHELAHNFGDVGEEYDAGDDYSGPNFATSTRVCRPGEGPNVMTNPDVGEPAREVWPCVSWGKWLTPVGTHAGPPASSSFAPPPPPPPPPPAAVKAEEAEMSIAEYPWRSIRDKPVVVRFDASERFGGGGYVSFSVTGAPLDSSVQVTLDGTPLPYRGPGNIDRNFHSQSLPAALLAPGPHTLVFSAATAGVSRTVVGSTGGKAVDTMLCHVQLWQYGKGYHTAGGDHDHAARAAQRSIAPAKEHVKVQGQEHEREHKEGYGHSLGTAATAPFVGAFPIFTPDAPRRVRGYRPTHNTCLMRDMRSRSLCPICQETLWLRLLRLPGVSLIHAVSAVLAVGRITVSVQTARLGSMRGPTSALGAREKLQLRWLRTTPRGVTRGGAGEDGEGGSHSATTMRTATWELDAAVAAGCWTVVVGLSTPEIRRPHHHDHHDDGYDHRWAKAAGGVGGAVGGTDGVHVQSNRTVLLRLDGTIEDGCDPRAYAEVVRASTGPGKTFERRMTTTARDPHARLRATTPPGVTMDGAAMGGIGGARAAPLPVASLLIASFAALAVLAIAMRTLTRSQSRCRRRSWVMFAVLAILFLVIAPIGVHFTMHHPRGGATHVLLVPPMSRSSPANTIMPANPTFPAAHAEHAEHAGHALPAVAAVTKVTKEPALPVMPVMPVVPTLPVTEKIGSGSPGGGKAKNPSVSTSAPAAAARRTPAARPRAVVTARVGRKCRHSRHGRDLVVDDAGVVCHRDFVIPEEGCCSPTKPSTASDNYPWHPPRSCQSCDADSKCCSVYELCVACCMRSNSTEQLIKSADRRRGRDGHFLRKHPACVAKGGRAGFDSCECVCRSDSYLSHHENEFITRERFCFHGDSIPPRQYMGVASNPGDSCSKACEEQDMRCDETFPGELNHCKALAQHFPGCKAAGKCVVSEGGRRSFPGMEGGICYTAAEGIAPQCNSRSSSVQRLCPCVHAG